MASDEQVQAHLIIRGYVQGVFFRARLTEEANSAGVQGWCRNLPDGSVEAALRGPPAAVDSTIAWARVGPPGARVDSVDVDWRSEADITAGTFEIRG